VSSRGGNVRNNLSPGDLITVNISVNVGDIDQVPSVARRDLRGPENALVSLPPAPPVVSGLVQHLFPAAGVVAGPLVPPNAALGFPAVVGAGIHVLVGELQVDDPVPLEADVSAETLLVDQVLRTPVHGPRECCLAVPSE